MPTEKEYLAKQSLLDAKQDKLIAGQGITIDPVTNTISAQTGGGTVTDVKVDNVSVVNGFGVANIDLATPMATKQNTLVPGTNITIDPVTNQISASGGSEVEANPTGTATGTLTKLGIDGDVYDISGSGGTTVVPNPVGTPADTLNTVEIDGVIYDIEGGGGASHTMIDTLYTGTQRETTVTLTNSYEDYDLLIIECTAVSGSDIFKNSISYTPKDLALNQKVGISDDISYLWYIISSTTSLTYYSSGGSSYYISSITGMKFGGGSDVEANPQDTPTDTLNTIEINGVVYDIAGSGGGGMATIRDTLWTGLISTVGATGTLTKNFDNYDYLLIYGVVSINNAQPEHHIAIVDAQRLKDELDTNSIAYFSYEYYDTQYIRCKFTTETAFDCTEKYGDYSFDTIVGIKLGGGDAVDDILYTDTTGTTGIQTITLNQRLDSYEAIYFEFYFPAETTYVEANPSPLQMLIETPAGATNKYLLQSYPSYGNRYILLTSADGGKTATLTTSAWGEGTYPSIYRIHGVRFGGTGGGADVEANPQDTPTDTLNTIRIGETVYDIAGSGGGSEGTYSTTLLWNYIDDNSGVIDYGVFNYTLNDNINNYDSLVIENVSFSEDISNVDWNATNIFSIDVNALNNSLNSNYINYTSFSDRSSRYYIKDTTFQKTINNQGNTNGLVNVYGIKYGGNASNKGDLLYVASTVAGAPVGTAQNYLTNRSFKDYDLITVILSNSGDTGGGAYMLLSPASFVPSSLTKLDESGDYSLCFTSYGARITIVSFGEHSFTVTLAQSSGEDASRIQSIYKMYGFKFTGNSSGGIDVEANPQDSPTDTLETIRIGEVVYDIAGSGSGGLGGGCKIDTLYQAASSSGASLNTPITYDNGKHLSDYDLCYVYLTVTASGDATLFESHSFCPKDQPRPVFRVTGYGNRFTNVEMTDTNFTVTAETGESWDYTYKVYTILGIKFGSNQSSSDSSEIIPIEAGNNTTTRTFTFAKQPQFIKFYWGDPVISGGWATDAELVWGQTYINYRSKPMGVTTSQVDGGIASIAYGADNKSFTITGANAFGAMNTSNGSGYMFVDYGGSIITTAYEDIAEGEWTSLLVHTPVSGGSWSAATAIPTDATHIAMMVNYRSTNYEPMILRLADLDKMAEATGNSNVKGGYQWQVGSDYDKVAYDYDSVNKTISVYAGYNGLSVNVFSIKADTPSQDRNAESRTDTIWSGSETTSAWVSPIILDDLPLDDYDMLSVQINDTQQLVMVNQIPTGDSDGNINIGLGGFLRNNDATATLQIFLNRVGNTLRMFTGTGNSANLTKIAGIKFANAKANPMCYAEVEREVGTWTDGKPLYQRTFDLSNTTFSDNAWTNNILGTSGINIKKFEGYFGLVGYDSRFPLDYYRSSGEYFTSMTNNDSTDLSFRPNMNAGVGVRGDIVTIWYTKDSDVAGSGMYTSTGTPTVHYSTVEHVVGTWIDGKPIYERSYTNFNGLTGQTRTLNFGLSGIENIWYVSEACVISNGLYPFPYVHWDMNNNAVGGFFDLNNGIPLFEFRTGSQSTGAVINVFTIRYTKSTT